MLQADLKGVSKSFTPRSSKCTDSNPPSVVCAWIPSSRIDLPGRPFQLGRARGRCRRVSILCVFGHLRCAYCAPFPHERDKASEECEKCQRPDADTDTDASFGA